ncbi:MAG: hypothetical protein AMXMBFR20_14570 [Planctomycetia bacterium]|nr:MAG: hypothetical protein B6D36_06310 [Planctomycetes bacterium UTPLA1]
MRGRRFGGIFLTIIMAIGAITSATGANTTADGVLGQGNFVDNAPNPPVGSPTAANLALSNAAHLAVSPDGRIYVSDPDNHRVLSWPTARLLANGAPADMVIGQPDFVSAVPNNGGLSASSLFLPQGVWVDGDRNLWVADAFNNRVLKFNDPLTDGSPGAADLVIGQPDFVHADANLGGGFTGVDVATAQSILFPGRVVVSGDDVWVADAGNSRVLHYTNPTTNLPAADLVLGQFDDFNCRVKNNDGTCTEKFGDLASSDNLFNPIGLALSASGALYVADWNNHRVLRFDDPLVTDTTADAVYGQPDLDSNAPDNGGTLAGLELPIDVIVDGAGDLFVADSGNNRVLVYLDAAADASPDLVFGQLGSLSSSDVNHGLGFFATDADGLFGPTGVALDFAGNVYVADTNNSRVLRFDVPINRLGDLNCDEVVDLMDVQPFVLAVVDQDAYETAFPGCPPSLADMNQDGRIDAADVQQFILLLTNG